MSTKKDRPDYGLILSNACPFRGEDKSCNNTENPKLELGISVAYMLKKLLS